MEEREDKCIMYIVDIVSRYFPDIYKCAVIAMYKDDLEKIPHKLEDIENNLNAIEQIRMSCFLYGYFNSYISFIVNKYNDNEDMKIFSKFTKYDEKSINIVISLWNEYYLKTNRPYDYLEFMEYLLASILPEIKEKEAKKKEIERKRNEKLQINRKMQELRTIIPYVINMINDRLPVNKIAEYMNISIEDVLLIKSEYNI